MYINPYQINEINLMDELVAMNEENALKKRLQKNISLTYMNNFNENRKNQRIKVFQQIQVYIKRSDFQKLKEFYNKNSLPDNNLLFKNSPTTKIKYNKPPNIPRAQLENSKDRLVFLQKLITSQTNGYDPIKNFMQTYRIKNKVVNQRRLRERELKLNFLKHKERKREKINLIKNVNTERIRFANKKWRNDIRNPKNKKKNTQLEWNIGSLRNIVPKNLKFERLKTIQEKNTDITENVDFMGCGMYRLPKYDRAIIFKFIINFDNTNDKVIDLIDIEGDLLLHMNIRNNKNIIFNSNIDNMWGKEIRVDKLLTEKAEIKILVKNNYFKVLVNNEILSFFTQRKESKINFLSININIEEFIFKIM